MMKLLSCIFICITIASMISSCKKDNPVVPPVEPPNVIKDTVTISVEGVNYRSIELNVQSTMNNSQFSIKLFRIFNSAETLVTEYPILVTDTTILDDNNGDGLQLNTEYRYYAVTVDTAGEKKDTSNILTAKTLAATSHNYTWQEFTIGEYGSTLTDVWGTSENNIYAVGTVDINDTAYGIIKWNGSEWLPEKKIGGQEAIYGFSESDIWTDGGGVYHFDGSTWEELTERYPVFLDNIEYLSLWGTDSNNMYFGNYWGKIIHWDGNNAVVMSSFSNTRIGDIYGLNNNFIIGVGNTGVVPSTVVKFDGSEWKIFEGIDFTNHLLASVYMINHEEYYIAGAFSYRYFGKEWQSIPGNMYRIRGNKETGEIVGVGPGNTLLHFNGEDWYDFKNEISQEYNALYGVFLIGNKIFAVGFNTTPVAKIFIGTRE